MTDKNNGSGNPAPRAPRRGASAVPAGNGADIDLENPEFQVAKRLVDNTNQSVFLTGRAGTGKSTFMRYILANTKKKYVVLAPTGIAAVNAGGQTIHSFFRLPFKPILPDDPDFAPKRIRKRLRYNQDLIKIIKDLDLLVIDEISMVRPDIIDIIDRILRIYSGRRHLPFGGKQLLMVGDMFQLEPVVVGDERDIMARVYPAPLFFHALVFREFNIVPIELRKLYRQKDDAEFAGILDRIRSDSATAADYAVLNTRVNPAGNTDGMTMTLTLQRNVASAINAERLAALPGHEFTYLGTIEGVFKEDNLPAPKELVLKIGAQVVFVKNDPTRRWVNGTIGRVEKLEDKKISVRTEDGQLHSVDPEIWNNVKYVYNEEQHTIDEEVLGSYAQFPLQLAWAITVHKSQGLTFSNIIIDYGNSPAFTAGQTYVALSRCTSLGGITLRQPISSRDVRVRHDVLEFAKRFNDDEAVRRALDDAHANQLYVRAAEKAGAGDFHGAVADFLEAQTLQPVTDSPLVRRLILLKSLKAKKITEERDALLEKAKADAEKLHRAALEAVALARKALEDDNLFHAEMCIQKALDYADCWEAHDVLARIALADSDSEKARLHLTLACSSPDISEPMPFVMLGDLHAADPVAAMAAYLKGEELFPDSRKILERIRDVYEMLEDDEGVEVYNEKLNDLADRNL